MNLALELLGDLHWTFVSVGLVSSVLFLGLMLRVRPRRPEGIALPPITILRPFDGVDPDLETNFWSYVEAEYPAEREILFCTARENVDGIAIAEQIVERIRREAIPGVSARVLLPEVGETPWVTRKVWHMARGLAAAAHDVVVNADSGTRVGPRTLGVLVGTLLGAERRGAVWAPYDVTTGGSLGARLTRVAWTATTMNFLVLEGVYRALRAPVMLAGGLFAARRQALEELDGLRDCDGYLTEDMEVGFRLQANGWEVVPSREPVTRHLADLPVSGFVARQLRWNTIIWSFRNPFRWPYPLAMCGLAVAPFSFVFASLAFPERTGEYALALGALYVVRVLYGVVVSWLGGSRPTLDIALLMPFVDAVFLATWLRAPFVRTIRWRDVELAVRPGGKVTPAGRGAR